MPESGSAEGSEATGHSRRSTVDHGEIIHFAGRLHLFPVARADDRAAVRLASRDDGQAGEVRIGWPADFRPFTARTLVFVYDDQGGRAVTREEARTGGAGGP